MKKKFLLSFISLVASVSVLALSGCNKNAEESKIALDFGVIRNKEVTNIKELKGLTYNELVSKVQVNKESFLLALYGVEECGCWIDYQKVLIDFVNNTNMDIYYISALDFIGKDSDLGLYLVPSDLPSLAIFEAGTLKVQSVYLRDDRQMFKNYKNFQEFVDKYVIAPKMYYIEKDVLDSYISENKEFNLYIGRNECPDCNAINKDILLNWSHENKVTVNNPLYIFDIQQYYPNASSSDEEKELYQSIKDTYGLSEVNNPTFGYSTGMVPTFQRRKGNEITDMAVFLNDSLDRENKKVSSYFTEARVSQMNFLKDVKYLTILDGFALNDEQFNNWRTYRSEFYENYHHPIAKEFINKYIN